MSGYIGTQPVPQATQTRDAFTATAGQTSFATSGYTPNFLDVFLNGVKLAAADYTATNGSDVVLASGAVVNDILEVVAYTTFDTANVTGATNFTVTGAFTSQGIDDNGNATALTIDSSENVLIGRTDSGSQTEGTTIYNGGTIEVTNASDLALRLNRKTNDGTIIELRKDAGVVGSIRSGGNAIQIGTTNTGLYFADNIDSIAPYDISGGSVRDNAIDLGYSGGRYKDAYLSGGVYLGGAVAANKLDDYEEGTWTPTMIGSSSAGTMTYTDRIGRYQKVGRLVTIHFYIAGNSGNGSGNLLVAGLPFTISNYHLAYGSPQWNNGITYPSGVIDANFTRFNSTSFEIRCNKSNAAHASVQYPTTPDYLRGCITYETTQ